jgi:hypothetical protein
MSKSTQKSKFPKRFVFLTMITLLISFVVFCTKEITKPETTPTVNPSVTITSPSQDTTLAASTAGFQITGTITNPSAVQILTLTVNSTGYSDSINTARNGFALTYPLASDTTKIIVAITTSAGLSFSDTVTIYRSPRVAKKAAISGILTQEGSTLAKRTYLAKNAAGQTKVIQNNIVPVTGADILVYRADTASTASVASTKTNEKGEWTIENLNDGLYFAFAVFFDIKNKTVKTAAIQNIEARADTIIKTDTAVAAEDEVKPSVLSILDATSSDSNGLYLAGKVPEGKPILSVTFSEPMDRSLAGDSLRGVVLGRIDTSASSFSLLDTIPVAKNWNGNSTELRIKPLIALAANALYGIIVPVSLKDLAFNPLESKAMGTFSTVEITRIEPFTIAGTIPKNNDTIQPSAPIIINFSRAPDLISVSRKVTIDPPIKGHFALLGTKVIYKSEALVNAGKYTLTIPGSVTSVIGDSLGVATQITFMVKQLTGIATTVGDTGLLAQAILKGINGYQAGDIGTFSAMLDVDMVIIDDYKDNNGSPVKSIKGKEEFIRNMKSDLAFMATLRERGMYHPIWYLSGGSTPTLLYKVFARGDTASYVFVQAHGSGPFGAPNLYTADKTTLIPQNEIQFVPGRPEIIYKGKNYVFQPDMSSMGPITAEQAEKDQSFYGRMYKENSTVQCGIVKLFQNETFTLKKVDITSDTGHVFMLINSIKVWAGPTRPWPFIPGVQLPQNAGGEIDTTAEIQLIKMKCIKKAGVWLVIRMISEMIYDGTVANAANVTIDPARFIQTTQTFALPPSVALVSPVNRTERALNAANGITLKWQKATNDSAVKAYMIGISEDPSFTPCRPPKGLLIFAPKTVTEINIRPNGEIDTAGGIKAMVISKRPGELGLHMMPQYDSPLDKIGPLMVFQWKVIGIKDSSARDIINNNVIKNENIIAQSDFMNVKGVFATSVFLTPLQIDSLCKLQNQNNTHQQVNTFDDYDKDGVPDAEENRWGTNPRDPSNFPRFDIDSDGDKYADFLEEKLGSDPKDPAIIPVADKLAQLGYQDSDKDGFPDEVEKRLGTNPFDPNNNPGTRTAFEPPIGSFTGKLFFGSYQMDVVIKISKSEEATAADKDYSVVYKVLSTVVQDSVDTVKAVFDKNTGELIFLVELNRASPEGGKALKLRGRYDGVMGRLGGPVDIVRFAEGINASGPKVGEFAASNRGESLDKPINNNTNTANTVMQQLPQMPPNADTAYLIVTNTGNVISGKLIYAKNQLDTIATIKPGMKPGDINQLSFLTLIFKKLGTIMNLNGNQMVIQGSETVRYYGGLMLTDTTFRQLPYGGSFGFSKSDDSLTSWIGVYKGWIFIDTTVNNGTNNNQSFGGPPEYIGGVANFVTQLQTNYGPVKIGDTLNVARPSNTREIKKFVLDTTTTVLSVSKFPQFSMLNRGCVLIITTTNDTLLAFGRDDRNVVNIVITPTGKVVAAELPPGQPINNNTNPTGEGIPFQGDSLRVAYSIQQSGNQIAVMIPNQTVPQMVAVNPGSLMKKFIEQPMAMQVWVVNAGTAPNLKYYVILQKQGAPGEIGMIEGKPMAREFGTNNQTPAQSVIYTGDSLSIINALRLTSNTVAAAMPNLPELQMVVIDPATLKQIPNPQNASQQIWIITISTAQINKTYAFTAPGTNPRMLELKDSKPIVKEIQTQNNTTPTDLSPYTGDSLQVADALIKSQNQIAVVIPNQPNSQIVSIIPNSLKKIPNPQNSQQVFYLVSAGIAPAVKDYLILTKPGIIGPVIQDGKPLTKEYGNNQNPVQNQPYGGDSLTIVNALTISNNTVAAAIPNQTELQILTVSPSSIKRIPDPQNANQMLWVVLVGTDPAVRTLCFMAPGTDSKLLELKENRPTVKEIQTQNNTIPTNFQPFSGDSTRVANALTTSQNQIAVILPNQPSAQILTIIPNSLKKIPNPQNNQQIMYTVSTGIAPSIKDYIILCKSDTPLEPAIQDGKPVAKDAGNNQQEPLTPPPFRGDSVLVANALTASNNQVALGVPNQPTPQIITINPGSLIKRVDPNNPQNFSFIVMTGTAPNLKPLIIAANKTTPGQMAIYEGKPVVFEPVVR